MEHNHCYHLDVDKIHSLDELGSLGSSEDGVHRRVMVTGSMASTNLLTRVER